MTGLVAQEPRGGCRRGAARGRAGARTGDPPPCHCRMCWRATGGLSAALVPVPLGRFERTRGAPATFRSSEPVERGFCALCGTPLVHARVGGAHLALTHGSLGDPALVAPAFQDGNEPRPPFVDGLALLPSRGPTGDGRGPPARRIAATDRQRP